MMEKIGQRIRAVRKEAGLKQKEFAKRVHINPNYPSQIECGHRAPGSRLIKDVCEVFNVHKAWLVANEGPMHPEPVQIPTSPDDTRQAGASESQPANPSSKGGNESLNLNLEKIFKNYPQLKYALVFADDENEKELHRIIKNWAKELNALGEEQRTPVQANGGV